MKAKSFILLWMAGGPSHIDTWDPKPDRPDEEPRARSASSPRSFPACRSASTCRSRRRCSTSSRSSARSMPGTAITSRTRSSRPGNSTRPKRGPIPRRKCTRPSARCRQAPWREPPGMPPYVAFMQARGRTSPSPATWASSTIRSSPTRLCLCRLERLTRPATTTSRVGTPCRRLRAAARGSPTFARRRPSHPTCG